MRSALIGAVVACAAMGAPVMSQETVQLGTVVELYTSQGCSSCPPADEYLRDLAAQPGVIALSLHVDYWDYIGWKDSFGQARFTDRQKAYALAEGSHTIYTPQMIVAGGARIEGVNPGAVSEAIAKAQGQPAPLTLRLTREGDQMRIAADAPQKALGPMRVQLVRFLPEAQVMIEAGENAGRMVDYTNVVTSWAVVGEWDGMAPLALTADVPGPEGVVVIVQAEGPGPIHAAALSR
ncbi:DUF1223 domain-containing protein [Stagnihabitans tardus]|uniref:DUF1223 domain-containing protein n=1 Tax=Stagnihabitans tardus TaxID=2699202 RepID=A0AAE4Y5N5_9RHOB|nr:DUF1223 domain-containing protein [Stagnihabitans tardus]NBZ86187.1 DUF1223 domain-containing protein [Stagnihabitans tardus]